MLLEAKKFSGSPGQFTQVTRENLYHVSITELLIRNLISQVADSFSVGTNNFSKNQRK